MGTCAAIFDLDGTLIDSLPGIEFSVDCALAECKLPPRTADLRPLIGPPIRSIIARIVENATPEQLSDLEAAFRRSYDTDGWQKTILHAHVANVLEELGRNGVLLFVATNKPELATGRILKALGIEHYFSAVICRDSVAPPFASKAHMLSHIARRFNFRPGECIYVGDTNEDYHAGLDAQIPVLLVGHGYGLHLFELRSAAAVRLESLADLVSIVSTMEIA